MSNIYFQVLRSRREVVFPSLVLVVVLVVDEVRLAAAVSEAAALPVDVEVPEEVVPVVVAFRGEEVAPEVAGPLVVASRQSLSCLLPSYFGVWGNRELLQEPLSLYTLVHTTKEKCCLSFREYCSMALSLVSQCFTIIYISLLVDRLYTQHAPGQLFFLSPAGATMMFLLWLLLVAETATFCGNDVNHNRRVRAF